MPPAETPAPAWMGLIEAALVIFLAVFVLIVLKVLLTRRSHYRDVARIPLDDERIVEMRSGNAGGPPKQGEPGRRP